MQAAILATRRTSPLTRTNEGGRGTPGARAISREPRSSRPTSFRDDARRNPCDPAYFSADPDKRSGARNSRGESNQPRAGTPPPLSSRPASLRDDASRNPCDPAYFSADPYKRSGARNSRGESNQPRVGVPSAPVVHAGEPSRSRAPAQSGKEKHAAIPAPRIILSTATSLLANPEGAGAAQKAGAALRRHQRPPHVTRSANPCSGRLRGAFRSTLPPAATLAHRRIRRRPPQRNLHPLRDLPAPLHTLRPHLVPLRIGHKRRPRTLPLPEIGKRRDVHQIG